MRKIKVNLFLSASACLVPIVFLGCSNPQATVHEPIPPTITPRQAIHIASGLKTGMREEAAERYLKRHGLEEENKAGDSLGWHDFFSLTDRGYLVLEIKPKGLRPDGEWLDGFLQGTSVESNGVTIATLEP